MNRLELEVDTSEQSSNKQFCNQKIKDTILISLLEYFFKQNGYNENLFKSMCKYLYTINIINDKEIYSDKKRNIRKSYINNIINITEKHNKITTNDNDLEPSNAFIKSLEQSRYNIDFIEGKCIGDGNFGKVYKAINKYDNITYAVKKVPFKKINNKSYIKLLKEVQILAKLQHNNIVRYYTSWIEFIDTNNFIEKSISYDNITNSNYHEIIKRNKNNNDIPTYYPILFIQMEYCNMTLRDYINKRNINCKMVNNELENKYINEIITGVKYIHSKGIIHRDLNPNNIFFDKDMTIKIGDFGIAIKENEQNDNVSYIYGSQLYASPEQLNNKKLTYTSDIYSIGIIYFELLHIFNTSMERIDMITQLRNNKLDNYNGKKQIEKMIIKNPYKRNL